MRIKFKIFLYISSTSITKFVIAKYHNKKDREMRNTHGNFILTMIRTTHNTRGYKSARPKQPD